MARWHFRPTSRRAAPSWSSTASTWPARSRSRSRHGRRHHCRSRMGGCGCSDERSRSTSCWRRPGARRSPWLQRLLTGAAARARPRTIRTAWPSPTLGTRSSQEATWTFHRDRGPAQRGQVDALQRSDRNEVLAANYPFATIEPNVGVVAVPMTASTTWVRSTRASGWSRHGHIRRHRRHRARRVRRRGPGKPIPRRHPECDAICQVVRAFHDDDVIHVEGKVDPDGDIATINTELILADLQTSTTGCRSSRRGEAPAGARPVVKAITAARAVLDEGRTISSAVARKELDRRTSPSCSC